MSYKAYVVSDNNGQYLGNIENKEITDLKDGEVRIKVKYSSLNYKDGLSASGNKGVTRNYPHVPGIDASGIVEESKSDKFNKGEMVLVTGYDLGMNTPGGFQQYITVPSDWVVKLPNGLDLKESMIIGTAGFTAALSVYKMINGGTKPEDGEVLVTGATGGVGSVAVAILAKLGYSVVAATGKLNHKDFLLSLGAKDVISRDEIDDKSGRPMLKSRFAGVIDTVGGNILTTALKSTKYNGNVTCCGLVASSDFTTSVFPFILKGVTLHGVDSVLCPMDLRLKLWELISTTYKVDLAKLVNEISLEQLNEKISLILKGEIVGRTIVNLEK